MLNKLFLFYRLIVRSRYRWKPEELLICGISLYSIVIKYLLFRLIGKPYHVPINHQIYGKLYFPTDKLIEGYSFIEVGNNYLVNLKSFFPTFSIDKLDNIIDVGAHVGAMSFPLRDQDVNFIFYEPNIKNFASLLLNSHFLKKSQCFNKAVSNAGGPVQFVSGRTSTTGHLKDIKVFKKRLDVKIPFSKTNADIELIPSLSFEEILSSLNKNQINLLKIDIEGAEHEILSKANFDLAEKVKYLILEVHPVDGYDEGLIEKLLLHQGFNVNKMSIGNGCFEIYACAA